MPVFGENKKTVEKTKKTEKLALFTGFWALQSVTLCLRHPGVISI
jgi:hypothetical protein